MVSWGLTFTSSKVAWNAQVVNAGRQPVALADVLIQDAWLSPLPWYFNWASSVRALRWIPRLRAAWQGVTANTASPEGGINFPLILQPGHPVTFTFEGDDVARLGAGPLYVVVRDVLGHSIGQRLDDELLARAEAWPRRNSPP